MGNIYNVHNVAAYFIYELNEQHSFINLEFLQMLLVNVDKQWQTVFGHSAFNECLQSAEGKTFFKEIEDAYIKGGKDHIELPAKDWYLEYGQFQLIYRTYGVPSFNENERQIVDTIIEKYKAIHFRKVS